MGELLAPLAFGWALFITLFVFSLELFRLAQLGARGARLEAVAELLWLRIVLSSVYCLPMAMLLSALTAFGRLSGDSELTAMQASGIRNLRVVRNAFILGLALSVAGVAMNEYVIPPAGRRFHALQEQVKAEIAGQVAETIQGDRATVIQEMQRGELVRVVIARRFEPARGGKPATLRGVTYMQYSRGELEEVIQAKRAEWIGPDERAGRQVWRFFDARTQIFQRVTKGRNIAWRQKRLDLTLEKSPEQVAQQEKEADQMGYRELDAYIRELRLQGVKKKTIRELEVELERKLSVPFAAAVLALIGAPLGIRRQRSSTGVGVGMSLVIIILYYIGMSLLGVMGQNGKIGPVEAAWGCNVAGLLAGLYLTWRSSA